MTMSEEELVSRPLIHVRRVTQDDQGDFAALWYVARAEAGPTREGPARPVDDGRLAAALAREDVRAYLAVADDRPVGFMVLAHSPLGGLTESPSVCVDQLYVAPEARRMGVARALLTTAAMYADVVGAEQIATSVPAQARDTNRFFARLGFTPLVVRRVTATAALHRKLAGSTKEKADSVLLHRRRSLRARASRTAAAAR